MERYNPAISLSLNYLDSGFVTNQQVRIGRNSQGSRIAPAEPGGTVELPSVRPLNRGVLLDADISQLRHRSVAHELTVPDAGSSTSLYVDCKFLLEEKSRALKEKEEQLEKAELQLKENDRVLIEKDLRLKELELKLQESRVDCVATVVKLIHSLRAGKAMIEAKRDNKSQDLKDYLQSDFLTGLRDSGSCTIVFAEHLSLSDYPEVKVLRQGLEEFGAVQDEQMKEESLSLCQKILQNKIRVGGVSLGTAMVGYGCYYIYIGQKCYSITDGSEADSSEDCARKVGNGVFLVCTGSTLCILGVLCNNLDRLKSFCTGLPDMIRSCMGRSNPQSMPSQGAQTGSIRLSNVHESTVAGRHTQV